MGILLKTNTSGSKQGFTIVELLIVIVVIAILAAITIVSYSGITKKATESLLKSDLQQVSTQLGVIKAELDSYPDDKTGLKVSNEANLQYTKTSAYTYCISVASKGQSYYLDSTSGEIKAGLCSGHSTPLDPNDKSVWRQISVGGNHTCAIASDDRVYCWGGGANGQLGNNSTSDSRVPVAVDSSGILDGKTIKQVGAGNRHTCVVASDDKAYCWGYGQYGQLGDGSVVDSSVPVAVSTSGVLSGKTFRQINAGDFHTCAVASDDKAYCWGYGSSGRLGNNSTEDSFVPVAVDASESLSGKTIKQMSVGSAHTCVVASDSNTYCWGDGNSGRLGNNSNSGSAVPVAVDSSGVLAGKAIKQMSVGNGRGHTCVIASDDKAYCWGSNMSGQLGNGSIATYYVPMKVDPYDTLAGKTIKQISTGSSHTCAVTSDGNAYCWGSGAYGRLGNNSTAIAYDPVAVSASGVLAGKTVEQIGAGSTHTCALASDNRAYCWGYSMNGQLGNNSTENSSIPVLVLPRP